jgi:hypothetical protein
MKAAYEGGAQYVAHIQLPHYRRQLCGILQEEHLRRYSVSGMMQCITQNPNGGVVEDFLVLPQNFGFGMRSAT